MIVNFTCETVSKVLICCTEIATFVTIILHAVSAVEEVTWATYTFSFSEGTLKADGLCTCVLALRASNDWFISEHALVTGEVDCASETLILTAVLAGWI